MKRYGENKVALTKLIKRAVLFVPLVGTLLAFAAGVGFTQTLSFTPATNFAVASTPVSVAVGVLTGMGNRIWRWRIKAATLFRSFWVQARGVLARPRTLLWGVPRSQWRWGILTGTGNRIWRWRIMVATMSPSFWVRARGVLPWPRTMLWGVSRS